MEIIRGRQTSFITTTTLAERLAGYKTVHIDLGTGDGRFVQYIAQTDPRCFAIGIDACRENLQAVSRHAPDNALFVIANAQTLPPELYGVAAHITINFPWGSLLTDLLNNDAAVLESLISVACPRSGLEIRLNGGALSEAGWLLEKGAARVRAVLAENGFNMRPPVTLAACELRAYPTTWAKRLAFGRDPRAIYLRGVMTNVAKMAGPINMVERSEPLSKWASP